MITLDQLAESAFAIVRAAASEKCVEPAPKYVLDARELAPMLPEPADPDIEEARKLAEPWLIYDDVSLLRVGSSPSLTALLAAIKRGRELARGSSNTGGGE